MKTVRSVSIVKAQDDHNRHTIAGVSRYTIHTPIAPTIGATDDGDHPAFDPVTLFNQTLNP